MMCQQVEVEASPCRRRMKHQRPSMDPMNGMKEACAFRDSVTSTASDSDIWNLDLSDIIKNDIINAMPSEPSRGAYRRSSSARDVSKALEDMSLEEKESEGNKRRPSLPKRLSKRTLAVSFHQVETRVFERVLGDNPSCSGGGPSLGLGWNYNEQQAIDLETYEISKSKASKKGNLSPFRSMVANKKKKDLLLSPAKREKLAKKLGFSKEEIEKNVQEVQKAKRQRNRTVKALEQEAVAKLRGQLFSNLVCGSSA